ncbi:MAG: HPP family protein [Chloroflexi bacterium]|nr:HPP family protein [Chloroflexota bacterium]
MGTIFYRSIYPLSSLPGHPPVWCNQVLHIPKNSIIDPSFHGRARSYFLQSTLAAVALAAILLVETGVSSAAINASIASSVFLVFVVPHSVAASTRRVVGGHVVGVIVGVTAFGVVSLFVEHPTHLSGQTFAIAGATSVGVAILLMALTDTEHPPSAGTALSLVAIGANFDAIWFILSAAVILAGVRIALSRWMVNLL